MIAGDIRVTVVSVKGDKVRLGIVAPSGVVVDRYEIHQRRQASVQKPAGQQSPGPMGFLEVALGDVRTGAVVRRLLPASAGGP